MRKIWGAAGLAAVALVLTACGSSSNSTGAAAQSSSPAAQGSGAAAAASSPASSSGGTTLQAATVGGTKVLTNAKGFVVYWFAPDTSTTSKCTGSCATYWPPVTGRAIAGPGVTVHPTDSLTSYTPLA